MKKLGNLDIRQDEGDGRLEDGLVQVQVQGLVREQRQEVVPQRSDTELGSIHKDLIEAGNFKRMSFVIIAVMVTINVYRNDHRDY